MDVYNSTSSAPAEMFLQYVLFWELTYPFPKTLLSRWISELPKLGQCNFRRKKHLQKTYNTKNHPNNTIPSSPPNPPQKHIASRFLPLTTTTTKKPAAWMGMIGASTSDAASTEVEASARWLSFSVGGRSRPRNFTIIKIFSKWGHATSPWPV